MQRQLQSLYVLLFGATLVFLASCQKENGDDTPPNPKPKVGTVWTFSYYTYLPSGDFMTSKTITWKAVSQESIGGKTWLRIKEQGVDTTVLLLREEADGLYQYANGGARLFCKNPAAVNDTYTSFHRDSLFEFKVIATGLTLPTNIGDVKVNLYEARKASDLIDEIWYNTNAWIVRHQYYRKPVFGSYYKYAAYFIRDIVY